MLPPGTITDIAHVIQTVMAPVFLLVGIGAFINAFAGRLSRIVDRSRVLEQQSMREPARTELHTLKRRARTVYLGITMGIASALLVCLSIALAFVGHFLATNVAAVIGVLFIAAMITLIGALLAFLREVFLAIRALGAVD